MMSLQQWAVNGWLKAHKTSPQEIENLLAIVNRDLADAQSRQISADPLSLLRLPSSSAVALAEALGALASLTMRL